MEEIFIKLHKQFNRMNNTSKSRTATHEERSDANQEQLPTEEFAVVLVSQAADKHQTQSQKL